VSRVCTWEGCRKPATAVHKDSAGVAWADLCGTHDKQLTVVLGDPKPAAMMRAWIKAQGGAARTAKRVVPLRG